MSHTTYSTRCFDPWYLQNFVLVLLFALKKLVFALLFVSEEVLLLK